MIKKNREINPNKNYTPCEVGLLLRKSLSSIYRMLKKKSLASSKFEGEWRVKGIDIINYIERCKV